MARLAHEASHRLRGEYACEVCGQVFDLPQGRGAHMKAKHGIVTEKKAKPKSNGRDKDLSLEERMWRRTEKDTVPEPQSLPNIQEQIKAVFAPLVAQYNMLQTRQQELTRELEQNEQDLRELWSVLAAAPVASGLTPPQTAEPHGVQVAFEKRVSDHLRYRFEEFLANRRNSFTAPDVSRSLAVSQSTGNKLVSEFRKEGKLRLVGRRGRANSYQSTIFRAG